MKIEERGNGATRRKQATSITLSASVYPSSMEMLLNLKVAASRAAKSLSMPADMKDQTCAGRF
jgi:hypothetical protein